MKLFSPYIVTHNGNLSVSLTNKTEFQDGNS